MSAAAATARLPKGFGAEWVKDPIDIEAWPRAARRVYRYFKRRVRMRKAEHQVKDREIALDIGEADGIGIPHRRTIQRGLKFLQGIGGIFRDHSGGHGRVIKVNLPLAGDGDAKEKKGAPARNSAKAGPTDQAAPSPATAAAAAPPQPSEPVEDPAPPIDRPRSPREIFAAAAAQVAAELEETTQEPEAAPSLPRKQLRGVLDDDLALLEIKERMRDLKPSERARLDALRSGRDP